MASSGMAWKAEETEDGVTAMSSTDIKWARWLRVARGFQLRVGLKDRRREAFDGFERDVSLYQCERSAISLDALRSGSRQTRQLVEAALRHLIRN